jgi:hypothetical protein
VKKIAKVTIVLATLALLLTTLAACGSSVPATTTPSGSSPPPSSSSSTPGAFPLEVTPVLEGVADQPCTVTATTTPGAKCTIVVTNPKTGTKSSYPTDKEKVADASGKAVWTWTIHRQVAKGDGTITVTAEKDGKTVTKEAVFRVIRSEY